MYDKQLVRSAQVGIPYSTTKFIAQHIMQRRCRRRLFNSRSRVSPELRLCARPLLLLRFHSAIVQAGLLTDEHLHQLFRMSPTSRDRVHFKSTRHKEVNLIERVAVMDILEQMQMSNESL
ncbi:hypothetical protein BDR07DRAFT_1440935 [Suillus spraguei]|nr:hypothetical protein BDR07DRAFT_1440935 [Suillus spraguei]